MKLALPKRWLDAGWVLDVAKPPRYLRRKPRHKSYDLRDPRGRRRLSSVPRNRVHKFVIARGGAGHGA